MLIKEALTISREGDIAGDVPDSLISQIMEEMHQRVHALFPGGQM